MERRPLHPEELAAYETAGDLLHILKAFCSAGAFRAETAADPDRAAVAHWRQLAADRDRAWRRLDPADREATEAFTAECRRLVADLGVGR